MDLKCKRGEDIDGYPRILSMFLECLLDRNGNSCNDHQYCPIILWVEVNYPLGVKARPKDCSLPANTEFKINGKFMAIGVNGCLDNPPTS